MSRLDDIVEHGARRLKGLSDQLAREGGAQAKLAEPLAEDAEFLRKLKPSLIAARARGERPVQPPPQSGASTPSPAPRRPKPRKSPGSDSGPNPFVVIGVAFVAGVFLAKWIDWRGHAHPRA